MVFATVVMPRAHVTLSMIFTLSFPTNPFTCIYQRAVVHVVSSSKFAQKAEEAGCDAVVAEGFEAGGHNGREETTTMVGAECTVRVYVGWP
jgi:NAD(P)H-dependent flavin oxidoreductase YrpB (nitropropane dioxygenase family)